MTIHAWIDYWYYDGLLCFSKVLLYLDPDSPITSASVRWLNSEASASGRDWSPWSCRP